LPEREAQQHRRVHVRNHRCPWRSSAYLSKSPLYADVEQKRYVAYAIENTVRNALGMKPIALPPRPLA
jgi:hypothetical protein